MPKKIKTSELSQSAKNTNIYCNLCQKDSYENSWGNNFFDESNALRDSGKK